MFTLTEPSELLKILIIILLCCIFIGIICKKYKKLSCISVISQTSHILASISTIGLLLVASNPELIIKISEKVYEANELKKENENFKKENSKLKIDNTNLSADNENLNDEIYNKQKNITEINKKNDELSRRNMNLKVDQDKAFKQLYYTEITNIAINMKENFKKENIDTAMNFFSGEISIQCSINNNELKEMNQEINPRSRINRAIKKYANSNKMIPNDVIKSASSTILKSLDDIDSVSINQNYINEIIHRSQREIAMANSNAEKNIIARACSREIVIHFSYQLFESNKIIDNFFTSLAQSGR